MAAEARGMDEGAEVVFVLLRHAEPRTDLAASVGLGSSFLRTEGRLHAQRVRALLCTPPGLREPALHCSTIAVRGGYPPRLPANGRRAAVTRRVFQRARETAHLLGRGLGWRAATPTPALDTVHRALRGAVPAWRWPIKRQRCRARVRGSRPPPSCRLRSAAELTPGGPAAPTLAPLPLLLCALRRPQAALRWMAATAAHEAAAAAAAGVPVAPCRPVLAVSHNAAIQALLMELLGLETEAFRRLPCGYLHAAVLCAAAGKIRVLGVGLPPEEWTAVLAAASRGAELRRGAAAGARLRDLDPGAWLPPPGCAPHVRRWARVVAVSGAGCAGSGSGDVAEDALVACLGSGGASALLAAAVPRRRGVCAVLEVIVARPASSEVFPLHASSARASSGCSSFAGDGWLLCALTVRPRARLAHADRLPAA